LSIGIYDSGVGGLTVLQEIRRILPNESVIYVGDTARVPYGAKDADTLFSYGKEIVRFLLDKGAKIIVLACGTTSSTIFERLQQEFPTVTFVDVIRPGVIACAKMAEENPHLRWGFIATSATIRSGLFVQMLKDKSENENIVIHARPCPLFAPMVEAGINHPHFAFNFVAETYLGDLQNQIDALVLGCTHYPLINLKPILGDINYINLATYVAEATKEHLKNMGNSSENAVITFYVSGIPETFAKAVRIILNEDFPVYLMGQSV